MCLKSLNASAVERWSQIRFWSRNCLRRASCQLLFDIRFLKDVLSGGAPPPKDAEGEPRASHQLETESKKLQESFAKLENGLAGTYVI